MERQENMDRLTERDEFGNADIIGVDSMDLQCNLEFDEFNKVTNALNKLAKYEDLEEQNKLLKLPCAVGDTVYTIYSDEDGSFIEEPKAEEVSTHRVWIDSMYFDYDDFGKTVFLTREEAEAALKELERGKGE